MTRTEPQRVWVFLADQTISLPQIPAASGVHYSSGRAALRIRGARARIELDGAAHAGCVDQPQEARWEDARLRGVSLLAIGIEPEWSLEMDGRESRVTLEEDGAQRTKILPLAEVVEAAGRTMYESRVDGRPVRLEVEDRPCRTRGGQGSQPLTVSLTLGTRTYHGCGRRLAGS